MLGVVWLVQRRVARGGTGNGGAKVGSTKNGGARKDRTRESVRVVAKRGIGAKAQLVVVDIDDVRYVLGVTDGGITVIDQHASVEDARAPRGIAAVAPVTALPTAAAAAPRQDAVDSLPLRRTHGQTRANSQTRADARAARSTSLTGFLQKDAAQVLRRALGA